MEVERGDAGDEVRGQQLAAFYQRELALYRHRRLDRPIADFCLDHDLHPVFKAGPPHAPAALALTVTCTLRSTKAHTPARAFACPVQELYHRYSMPSAELFNAECLEVAADYLFLLCGYRGLALAQELWCKKGAPTAELLGAIRLEPPLPVTPPLPPPRPPAAVLERLTGPGDAVGALLQYRHQGFMANRRQQRMGGLAAIELAQALRHLVLLLPRPTALRAPCQREWTARGCFLSGCMHNLAVDCYSRVAPC